MIAASPSRDFHFGMSSRVADERLAYLGRARRGGGANDCA